MILSRLHNYSVQPRFKSPFFKIIFPEPLPLGRVTSNHFDPGSGRNTDFTHRPIPRLAISGPRCSPLITLHMTKGSLVSEGLLQHVTKLVHLTCQGTQTTLTFSRPIRKMTLYRASLIKAKFGSSNRTQCGWAKMRVIQPINLSKSLPSKSHF